MKHWRRVEATARRVLDQSVLHAVQRVASLDDRAMQQLPLWLQKTSRLIAFEWLRDADGLHGASGPVEARRAGDDAVEIRGKALDFDHRLTAAGGAPVPVR